MIGFVKGCFVTVFSLAWIALLVFLKWAVPVVIIVCVLRWMGVL